MNGTTKSTEVVREIATQALGEPTDFEWELLQHNVKRLAYLYGHREELKRAGDSAVRREFQAHVDDLIEEAKRETEKQADRLWRWRFTRRYK